ncbi:hypothetical protein [Clostridium sp.]|uniref:hypothetical protein n=1 Tax=Clostridium sp. TaxID=1506 RepID=UPI002672B305|nr:hypothetical protein [Clostridium sp.]MEE0567598.1 hypothetical protein [Clostridium sp.]
MKKEIKELILMVITVIFTIIQLIFFLQNTLTANKETTQLTNISETKNEDVKFSTINDELKSLENGIISDINDSGDSWKVKIILDGNKEEILNSLNKLNNMEKYTINEYNIDGNKGYFAVKLYLNRRK